MLNKKVFLVPLSLFIIGCNGINIGVNNQQKNVCDPQFFVNYTSKPGEIVGIGIAPMNFNGDAAQKKSAIAKAIEEIASQEGVKVNSAFISHKQVFNKVSNSNMESYSVHTINGKEVRARIVKECKAADGKYYVLMKAY